ncbi:Rec8p Ecym_6126 [Eremothecium cymbalariae DBVPG|uniref:Rad21/Rec8-like protein N-terminal domain-containing protein n=1 Tax=Eremothecium cymbalariae (strain CBS 270.75 / DBVPG 7215 / KCTC 17166 / NRRL Y-17582) TaxID=931890 RepID=G8JV39_ERECY|nr:hypothetical protein Ecym_6126 [Eremothecium cymbalariae DBVPG\
MAPYPSILLQYEDGNRNGQSGISIAWLLSNFGSSAATVTSVASNGGLTGSKCKKKDIINLSIPDTCQVISKTGVEMPLRFSSNLLYGVTVCYSKKTDFILSDVVQIKGQLQRKLFGLESQLRQNRGVAMEGRQKEVVGAQEFLNDDPLFDIGQWCNLRFDVGNDNGERQKKEIKQQDFLQEVNNNDESFLDNRSVAGGGRMRTMDDDLGSIDMDLNFDIDDLVSDDGGRQDELGSETSDENSKFELNFNDPFSNEHDKLPDVMEGSLLQEENNETTSSVKRPFGEGEDMDSEDGDAANNTTSESNPKRKMAKHNAVVFGRIVHDEKIGLLTDTLRANHKDYVELMEVQNSKTGGAGTKNDTMTWKDLLFLNSQPAFLQKAYQNLLDPDHEESGTLYFERGRSLAHVYSSLSSSRSSSVMSTEQGRRMAPNLETTRRSSQSDAHANFLPVFLEDEPFPEDYNFGGDDEGFQNENFMNTNLLPSSIGRISSRYSTADSGEQVEILRNAVNIQGRSMTTKRTGTDSSQHSDSSYQQAVSLGSDISKGQPIVLDEQNRKFYAYIKERADFVGKTTRSHPPFHKKLLFEDLIPSKISQQEADNPHEFKPVSKRIAATAFLSLLNLASKELIQLETFELENKCEVMKGDDVIIYC